MAEGRRLDIDIAKGIGIIMVVWAHANGPFSNYIEQFHMPFFFFVSGLLYQSETLSCREYAKRKCKSLLIPFWSWNIICLPIFFILYYWKNWSVSVFIKSLVEIIFTVNKVPFLGATWFLPALFWVSVLMHLGVKLFKGNDICLLIGGGVLCCVGINITLPYRISRTLICALFYVGGYCYKKHLENKIKGRVKNICACICGVVYILIACNNTVSLSENIFKYKIAFIIGAFAATAFVLRFANWISNLSICMWLPKHLSYLGRNSIDIVIWQFLAFRITIVIQIIVIHAGVKAITAFPVYDASGFWWFMYLIAGIYGSLAWKYILEHNPLSGYMKKLYMIR